MYDFNSILQRVTIRDILESHGIYSHKNRIPCPLHHGDNPTAFSFNDSTFYCFVCGASGGLIDLLIQLTGANRREAISQLEKMAGLEDCHTESFRDSRGETPFRPVITDSAQLEIDSLRLDLREIDLLRDCITAMARLAMRAVKEGRMSLVDYYTILHYTEAAGEEYDREYARIKNELTMKKRQISDAKRRANRRNRPQ